MSILFVRYTDIPINVIRRAVRDCDDCRTYLRKRPLSGEQKRMGRVINMLEIIRRRQSSWNPSVCGCWHWTIFSFFPLFPSSTPSTYFSVLPAPPSSFPSVPSPPNRSPQPPPNSALCQPSQWLISRRSVLRRRSYLRYILSFFCEGWCIWLIVAGRSYS